MTYEQPKVLTKRTSNRNPPKSLYQSTSINRSENDYLLNDVFVNNTELDILFAIKLKHFPQLSKNHLKLYKIHVMSKQKQDKISQIDSPAIYVSPPE